MNTDVYVSITPMAEPAVGCTAELERLGDEIAELSAHLDAATARLLELIREFDARASAWRARWGPCHGWGRRSRAASSRTRRFGRSPASRLPTPKSGCSRWAGRG